MLERKQIQFTAVQIKCDIQLQLYHYFDHNNIKASRTPSNLRICISSVDPQLIYRYTIYTYVIYKFGVCSDVTGCVGSALIPSASTGFGCAAPCQDITGSQKPGSVSRGHRLMAVISHKHTVSWSIH